jgi:hypothetical protein
MLSVGLRQRALIAFTQISQPVPRQKRPPNTKVEVGSNKGRQQQNNNQQKLNYGNRFERRPISDHLP